MSQSLESFTKMKRNEKITHLFNLSKKYAVVSIVAIILFSLLSILPYICYENLLEEENISFKMFHSILLGIITTISFIFIWLSDFYDYVTKLDMFYSYIIKVFKITFLLYSILILMYYIGSLLHPILFTQP